MHSVLQHGKLPRLPSRVWRVLLVLLLGATILYTLYPSKRRGSMEHALISGTTTQDECAIFPDTGRIAVSVKTGATEMINDKLSPILGTSLRCVKDVLIFSDLEQNVADFHVYDVLSRFSQSTIQTNPEFDLYRKQQELVSQHRESEIAAFSSVLAPPGEWTKGKSVGWALDKYKFIPMLEAAYELQPDRDWFVFVEADTYLSWSNLNRWLSTLDPREKLYIGNALQKSYLKQPRLFAHGGSGFVFSNGALQELVEDHKGLTTRFEDRMHEYWAGEMIVADVVYKEIGLQVTDAKPMFSGLSSREVALGEGLWCQPVVTLHYMDAAKYGEMYRFEQSMSFSPLHLRDMYFASYRNGLPNEKQDWDNLADEREFALDAVPFTISVKADSSVLDPNGDFESCRLACERNPKCFEFFFRNTTMAKAESPIEYQHSCHLSSVFRLGHHKPLQDFNNLEEPEVLRSWTSGWMVERITNWVKNQPNCPPI